MFIVPDSCSLFPKNTDFEIKIGGLGTLRAFSNTLELRYGIHPESQNLQWSNCTVQIVYKAIDSSGNLRLPQRSSKKTPGGHSRKGV